MDISLSHQECNKQMFGLIRMESIDNGAFRVMQSSIYAKADDVHTVDGNVMGISLLSKTRKLSWISIHTSRVIHMGYKMHIMIFPFRKFQVYEYLTLWESMETPGICTNKYIRVR